MKKGTKNVTTVKSNPAATTEGMIHHINCYLVDFACHIELLHCGTSN